MTEELKIVLEMITQTTQMGVVAFVSYLVYSLLLTLIKWGIPSLVVYKVVTKIFKE